MKIPSYILQAFTKAPGFEADAFEAAHERPAPQSIRINRKKMKDCPFPYSHAVPWCDDAFYLNERPLYAQHPLWHVGAFYVQEASSMFLHFVLKHLLPLDQSLCVLDACAAPGGKSTLIASLLGPNSVLVSNETVRSRASTLQENITKWGSAEVIVTNSDTRVFQSCANLFDAVVVDAPCSGSGLFRKDEQAIDEWSEANVQLCYERQQRIVANLIPSLKANGYMIYSTCSYSVQENEDVVTWICEEFGLEIVSIDVPAAWGLVNSLPGCYRFYPYHTEGEGFFMAILRKSGHTETTQLPEPHSFRRVKPNAAWLRYLKRGSNLSVFSHAEKLLAATSYVLSVAEMLKKHKLHIIQCGVEMGEMKGTDFVPSHALALCEWVSDEVPVVDVDEEGARRYVKKETLHFSDAAPGYYLIRYEGVHLGWVKVLKDRVNNLYPSSWRLLK